MARNNLRKLENANRTRSSIKSLIVHYLKNKNGHKADFNEIFNFLVENSKLGNVKLTGKTPKNTVYTTLWRSYEINRSGKRRKRIYEVNQ